MNDSSAREMIERQPQRPCGCVGIFFQLFDQNRTFSKKLFPKKLLSPEKLCARPSGSDKEDMDFEMVEIKSSEPGLQRFRAKCSLTYPTRYFSTLEDEADLVGNSHDQHSTDSYLSSSPNSRSKDKVLAESVDSVNDEPLFLEPDRDLSDCETSLFTRRGCRELIYNVSGVLSKIDQLKRSKLSYAKQVILNAELIFGTTPQQQALQEETQMKGCDTIGGMVANVDVSTAQKPIIRDKKSKKMGSPFGTSIEGRQSEMDSSKEIGCYAPEDPVLYINDCDFFGSAATMNMCSKCQKDMIQLKQEHVKLAATSSKGVVRRSSSSDESELALAGAAVASADLASHISQVMSKEGLRKCTTFRKCVGLTGFNCKCGDFFCAAHHYSEKHNYRFDYRNASQNVIAKENPIIVAKNLNKI
ncbi:hypothetical protein CQW23_31295 [Capsicum baccatum]|uniref:Zinc finger A20 and AN1 domain-containing stress-associated protein 8 n=1 Tax=Capsicum baccatum TaxID=33114 RepID=A0A2G2V817_CAPBA|nr:hypothetical protein CQW23_31295 [Capsicum baccatum]